MQPTVARRRDWLLALLALVVAGCPQTTSRPKTPATLASPPEGTWEGAIRHEGLGPFAASYDLRKPALLTPLQERVLKSLRQAAVKQSQLPPVADRATLRMAREICRGLPPKGPPAAALVEFAMRAHGLVEPPPHMIIADLPADIRQADLAGFATRFGEVLRSGSYSRVGVAACHPLATAKRHRLVVALTESRVRFAPVPRKWDLNEQRQLVIDAASSHRNLRLVIADPSGGVISRDVSGDGNGTHRADVQCQLRGVYRIEITGEGKFGSEVLANFPIYCGMIPPQVVRYERQVGPLPGDAAIEADIVRRTNAIRARHRLPALRVNEALAAVARDHSEDMQRANFVGHVSPTTGNAADRVRRAGLPYLVVRENVARAYSAAEAIVELNNSPAHRTNILSRDVTDIGVGVAVERTGDTSVLLVTQNFLKPARRFNIQTAGNDVLQIIAAARRAAGLAALKVSAPLNRLAEKHVRAITDGGQSTNDADATLRGALATLGGRFNRVQGVLIKLTAIEHVARAKELRSRSATHVGFAVTQQDDKVVIFILIAS